MWRGNVVSTSKVPGGKMLLEKLIIPWSTWKNLPSVQVELENCIFKWLFKLVFGKHCSVPGKYACDMRTDESECDSTQIFGFILPPPRSCGGKWLCRHQLKYFDQLFPTHSRFSFTFPSSAALGLQQASLPRNLGWEQARPQSHEGAPQRPSLQLLLGCGSSSS